MRDYLEVLSLMAIIVLVSVVVGCGCVIGVQKYQYSLDKTKYSDCLKENIAKERCELILLPSNYILKMREEKADASP